MYRLAILLGLYSYTIFFLGIFGLLYQNIILILSLLFITPFFYWFRDLKNAFLSSFKLFRSKSFIIVFLLITLQALVNLIGTLGPELSFDALWYHLTLPKIFLLNEKIFFIPGGLLYYSVMPKLTEMIYIGALVAQGEILAKLIHFLFGILILFTIYKIARMLKYSPILSLLASAIFYSNLVIGWESITAFADLSRAFFESLAFLGFINFVKYKKKKWVFLTGLMLGFAISAKLISIASIIIFVTLFIFVREKARYWNILYLLLFVGFSTFPWFVFSYIKTGNPFYPVFSGYPISYSFSLSNPIEAVKTFTNLLINSPDPLTPLYIILLPLAFLFFRKFNLYEKLVFLYVILGFIVWYFTPNTGGGRFIIGYLPVVSVLSVSVLKYIYDKRALSVLIFFIIITCFFSVIFRFGANAKFIPFLLGYEAKHEFLARNLNFSFGDFYDIDDYFKNNIKPTDKVLLFGFHNLYYIDFPFIDASWVKKGEKFNYIAVQNGEIPERFSKFKLIYENNISRVKLYTDSKKVWSY